MIEGELLAAVAASPNDDGPRLVYADWLQQQDDEVRRARGEYISLACTTVRPKPAAKLKELVDRHAAAWLGPIMQVTSHRGWSRGFLEGCAITPSSQRVDPALEHPEWSVLRVMIADGHLVDDPARLICQRAMKNLKVLSTDLRVLPRIVESALAPRIAELGVSNFAREPISGVAAFLDADCFALLRRLHLSCSASLLPMLLRVVPAELALIVTTRPRAVQDWLTELVALKANLAEVRLVRDSLPMLERNTLELVIYSAGGAWNHLEVRWPLEDDPNWRDEVILSLRRLPPDRIQQISFVGPASANFDTVRFKNRVSRTLPGATVV